MEKTYKASINMWELSTDAAHILHRIGSDDYPEIRKAMVKADYADSYEEVAVEDIPPYTKAEYDAKVAELVHERYTADEESALHRKMINAIMSPATVSEEGAADKALEEYEAYNAYVQGCKARAKELLGNATEQEN
jgi:hypothetical protein